MDALTLAVDVDVAQESVNAFMRMACLFPTPQSFLAACDMVRRTKPSTLHKLANGVLGPTNPAGLVGLALRTCDEEDRTLLFVCFVKGYIATGGVVKAEDIAAAFTKLGITIPKESNVWAQLVQKEKEGTLSAASVSDWLTRSASPWLKDHWLDIVEYAGGALIGGPLGLATVGGAKYLLDK